MKIKAKGIEEIDLPDGNYRARLGGNEVVILSNRQRFKVDRENDSLSYAGWAEIKNKKGKFESNGYY
jgi:hypothetical protein